MDWEVEAESNPDLMASLLFFKIIPICESELTDLQEMFLSLLLEILTLFSDLTESELETKLIPRIDQWISILPYMDLDPQSEPVLEPVADPGNFFTWVMIFIVSPTVTKSQDNSMVFFEKLINGCSRGFEPV